MSQASIVCMAMAGMYLALIGLRFYKTASAYFWADLSELAYESTAFLLYAFVVLTEVTLAPRTTLL